MAVASYFVALSLPQSFKSSGLLFVTREPDVSSTSYFTYEGYYSQQTAQQYTDSVLGILKSLPFKASVTSVNNNVIVQKLGPQLLSVTVSDGDAVVSKRLWKALSDQAVKTVTEINKNGDSKITLQLLNNDPLTEIVAVKPWLASMGVFFGLLALGLGLWSTWRYLKGVK